MRTSIFSACLVLVTLGVGWETVTTAQDAAGGRSLNGFRPESGIQPGTAASIAGNQLTPEDPAYRQLEVESPSLTPERMSVSEKRRALGWYRRMQSLARIEAARNAGYHLSRPPGIVNPSMQSQYPDYHTIVIPVYVDRSAR